MYLIVSKLYVNEGVLRRTPITGEKNDERTLRRSGGDGLIYKRMNVAIRDTKSFEMSSIWSRVFVCAIVQGWLQVSVEGVIRCHDNVTLKRPGPGSSKEDGNSNEGIDKSCFGERCKYPKLYYG